MIAIMLLLTAIGLSLIITRTAAVMLELTGMSRDSARFQARAAYCGVGYASRETDGIVEHPLRRRIISFLMLLGNAGTATVVATMIISFTKQDDGATPAVTKLAVVAGGLALLFLFARSKFVDRKMSLFVQWALKRFSSLDLSDYVALLNLSAGYSILEVDVHDGDWLSGRDLATLALPREGILVLGIRRNNGEYLGTPIGTTQVDIGDTLMVYGQLAQLEELNHRKHGTSGMYAHLAAVTERSKAEESNEEHTD